VTRQTFSRGLQPHTAHIDYLRMRCGKEPAFLDEIRNQSANRMAFISFAEWDVVLFMLSKELYSEELIRTYQDPNITTAIAGSAGYYNYAWDHEINKDWAARLLARAEPQQARRAARSDLLLLISLRFTDVFRCAYGVGAELLFCDFLREVRDEHPGLDLFALQSVGWNDMTVVLFAGPQQEHVLLEALSRIRYCTRAALRLAPHDNTLVLAATYSHILGNLDRYLDTQHETLSFGTLSPLVDRAQILVRVSPAMEPDIRQAYRDVAREVARRHNPQADLASELGHYNFSADIKWAFDLDGSAPVKLIQRLREKILARLPSERTLSTFPETTTKISFREDPPHVASSNASVPVVEQYTELVAELTGRAGNLVPRGAATKLTRHRFAVLFASISAHLADPVRGSIVGHICRFLASTFETVIERMQVHEKEDLCQVLEYAVNQATDGLSQFQYDANSLGLSGRGGYARVIHAMEQWTVDLVDGLGMNFAPLVTFGMRSARTAVKYRINVPFNTAFTPAWWPVIIHEIGHLCWYDIFGWRLDSVEVSNTLNEADVEAVGTSDSRFDIVSARTIAEEIFPNYLLLNVVALGDFEMLDRLMLEHELRDVPQRPRMRTRRLRTALHALLALHSRMRQPAGDVFGELARREDIPVAGPLAAKLEHIGVQWWTPWSELHTAPDLDARIAGAVREAAASIDAASAQANFDKRSTSETLREECARAVRASIRVLAALAHDLEVQRTKPVDRAYASFGEVLARIDAIRAGAAKSVVMKDYYLAGARNGEVFAEIPAATSLASMLAGLDSSEHNDPRLNLALMLSLWHRNITSMMLEKAPEFARQLRDRKLVVDLSAARTPGRA
jgi:hypothetical protein